MYLADILVLGGLLALTVGVFGIVRMPDIYLKLHTASKAVLLGSLPILAASALTGGWQIAGKAAMISALIILTTPIATHAITKAAATREEAENRRRL